MMEEIRRECFDCGSFNTEIEDGDLRCLDCNALFYIGGGHGK